ARVHLLPRALAQHAHGARIDPADRDVDEVDVRLLRQYAGDVVFEADPQPAERLAEQFVRLALGQGLIELFVRDETLAQQERAQVRARLVAEKRVVQTCRPHRAYIGISPP